MRRVALVVAVLMLTTACAKKVPLASGTRIPSSELQGLASYYAEPYAGRQTASGEVFDPYQELTAAHRTLPFNTVVKVTNQQNGRDVEVRINDRGPFVKGRVIDLSLKAAREIDMVRAGVVPVKLTVLKQNVPSQKEPTRAVAAALPQPSPLSPPPPATPPPSPPIALYTIQVGAFGSQDAAESLKKELEQRHQDVTIETFTTTSTFYRVRVGRLSDLAAAESLVKMLREEKLDPFVVRLN